MAILTNKGFNVTTEDRSGSLLTEFKFESGVPKNMMACHTAKIDRYFIRIYIILQTLIQRRCELRVTLSLAILEGSRRLEDTKKVTAF